MMFKKVFTFFDDVRPAACDVDYALLVARIATGVFFTVHGYSKFFGEAGLAGFAGMLANHGFPIVDIFAFLVAFAELFGGIALILGVMTRFWSLWLAIIAFVAWWTIKSFNIGAAGDLDVLALGLTIALLIAGPGAVSLSAKLKNRGETVTMPSV
ncbi:MAG: DoxX family protein [Candidatus Nomurabacteria bacterium]|nr:DoxX family protein [Candidatus Nomurabacteria bacterium]USN88179.1 MAG: DoxX family protein [Candidatus Nomurabacteria bacterium]